MRGMGGSGRDVICGDIIPVEWHLRHEQQQRERQQRDPDDVTEAARRSRIWGLSSSHAMQFSHENATLPTPIKGASNHEFWSYALKPNDEWLMTKQIRITNDRNDRINLRSAVFRISSFDLLRH